MRFSVITNCSWGAVICSLQLFLLLLLSDVAPPSEGSFLDHHHRPSTSGLISQLLLPDRFPDPFRILEQIPFTVDRDDVDISPARVDWKETPDAHFIMLDLPGLKKEEVKIEVEETNRVLRVSGERKKEEEEEEKKKGDHWHRVERSYGKFWRQFRLPHNVNLDAVNIKAKMENGVLTISIPKLSPDQIKAPKMVSIDDHHEQQQQQQQQQQENNKKVTIISNNDDTKQEL